MLLPAVAGACTRARVLKENRNRNFPLSLALLRSLAFLSFSLWLSLATTYSSRCATTRNSVERLLLLRCCCCCRCLRSLDTMFLCAWQPEFVFLLEKIDILSDTPMNNTVCTHTNTYTTLCSTSTRRKVCVQPSKNHP